MTKYILIALILVGCDDYQHELDSLKEACELHKQWLDGAYARVPQAERWGWPITAKEFENKCGGVV